MLKLCPHCNRKIPAFCDNEILSFVDHDDQNGRMCKGSSNYLQKLLPHPDNTIRNDFEPVGEKYCQWGIVQSGIDWWDHWQAKCGLEYPDHQEDRDENFIFCPKCAGRILFNRYVQSA